MTSVLISRHTRRRSCEDEDRDCAATSQGIQELPEAGRGKVGVSL